MKILYYLTLLTFCIVSESLYAQSGTSGIPKVDAESSAEVEVESETEEGKGAGAVAVSAAAAAISPYSAATVKTSGSLNISALLPAAKRNLDDNFKERDIGANNPNPAPIVIGLGEAEAEAEVETKAVAEVNNGVAIAGAGSAVSASGGGRSIYIDKNGNFALYPNDIALTVDAQSSTSTKTSAILITLPSPKTEPLDISDPGPVESNGVADTVGIQSGENIEYATASTKPYIQTSTEAEVEAEAEAEAEAETNIGAAAAAASGGGATVSNGDYARSDTKISLATSTSIDTVRIAIPDLELYSSITNPLQLKQTVNESNARKDPQPSNGKGLFEAEAEVEAEAEAEAEVDNNAAAAAAVAVGSGGSNGIGATSRAAAATSTSTSTAESVGLQIRNNDVIDEDTQIYESYDQNELDAEVSSTVEAEAEGNTPSSSTFTENISIGDAVAEASVELSQISIGTEAISKPAKTINLSFYKPKKNESTNRSNNNSNFESEDEAEAEAEAEAEIGYNSAAASAAAVGIQSKNTAYLIEAESSASTSTSTSVYDNLPNNQSEIHNPGPSIPGERGDFPPLSVVIDSLNIEVEVEAEAEAEVGFQAAAVAGAAAAAGFDDIQAVSNYKITDYFAAVASASGAVVNLSFSVPINGLAGEVTATAMAYDPEGRGVAVAVAVAGVPLADNLDNELEAEAKGSGTDTVVVSVTIMTDPSNSFIPKSLQNTSTFNDNNSNGSNKIDDANIEAEAEVEVETEAEAGFGVAAASAAASAAGYKSVTVSIAQTVTTKPDYICTDYVDNTWIGISDGNWFDTTSNWSLGIFPEFCHRIIIPENITITILNGKKGIGYALVLNSNSNLILDGSAKLNLILP